jgi:hypothetical protein
MEDDFKYVLLFPLLRGQQKLILAEPDLIAKPIGETIFRASSPPDVVIRAQAPSTTNLYGVHNLMTSETGNVHNYSA